MISILKRLRILIRDKASEDNWLANNVMLCTCSMRLHDVRQTVLWSFVSGGLIKVVKTPQMGELK